MTRPPNRGPLICVGGYAAGFVSSIRASHLSNSNSTMWTNWRWSAWVYGFGATSSSSKRGSDVYVIKELLLRYRRCSPPHPQKGSPQVVSASSILGFTFFATWKTPWNLRNLSNGLICPESQNYFHRGPNRCPCMPVSGRPVSCLMIF